MSSLVPLYLRTFPPAVPSGRRKSSPAYMKKTLDYILNAEHIGRPLIYKSALNYLGAMVYLLVCALLANPAKECSRKHSSNFIFCFCACVLLPIYLARLYVYHCVKDWKKALFHTKVIFYANNVLWAAFVIYGYIIFFHPAPPKQCFEQFEINFINYLGI